MAVTTIKKQKQQNFQCFYWTHLWADVVSVHVVGLCDAGRLGVAPTVEGGLRLGWRHRLVHAAFRRWHRLVVRVPACRIQFKATVLRGLIILEINSSNFLLSLTACFRKKGYATPSSQLRIKGTVSRDFLLLLFSMNQFPPGPWLHYKGRFEFFRKFAEIFAAQFSKKSSIRQIFMISFGHLWVRVSI